MATGTQNKRRLPGSPVRRVLDRLMDRTVDPEISRSLDQLQEALNEYGYDPFGFNPEYLRYILPFSALLYRHYFRVETHGIDNVPAKGRVLIIANHSGQIAIDGVMIGTGLLLDRKPPRMVRSMVERWVPSLPFLSYLFPRWGQIIGTPENCRALLEREEAILVFPEGVRGCNKTFDKRYQLQDFGNGFMRLALRHDVPIVPVAVVGAEEQIISLYNAERLGKMLGMPALPVGPGLCLGPAGMMTPLPVKYHLHFGEPMRFEGSPDDDDRTIAQKVDEVKHVISLMIRDGLNARRGIFF